MAESRKLFGLDEKINLAGRITTIREQWQRGKAREWRSGNGRGLAENPRRHWVILEVEKDPVSFEQFDISKADFNELEGKGRRDHG